MGIIENTKEIADLVKKMGNIDLYKQIVELEGQIINLSRENHQLKVKLHDLEKRVQEEQVMTFRKPFFYKDNDEEPYCPKCWEADHKAIHLDGPKEYTEGTCYLCLECKTTFYL